MPLKTLKLSNFQAHSKREIEFSPGVTTIKGPTDRGKSAILRALRWVCCNQPGGEGFIQEGEKIATVRLDLDEGTEIKREKGRAASTNTYEINGKELKAFGSSVPKEVVESLRIEPSINFQEQHDAPFWFSLTAGEVSKRLNAVINLSIIDSTLSNVSQAARKTRGRVELCLERVEDCEASLERMKGVQQRIEEFDLLDAEQKDIEYRQGGIDHLCREIDKAEEMKAKLAETELKELAKLLLLAGMILERKKYTEDLTKLLEAIEKNRFRRFPPPIKHLEEDFDDISKAEKEMILLDALIQEIKRLDQKATWKTLEHQKAEEEFHAEIKGQPCPTCGKIIEP